MERSPKYPRSSPRWEQVPEEINFPLATFSSLREILADILNGGGRLGVVGKWDMPGPIFDRVRGSLPNLEVVEADFHLLRDLRIVKSDIEIACLRESRAFLACVGYEKLLAAFASTREHGTSSGRRRRRAPRDAREPRSIAFDAFSVAATVQIPSLAARRIRLSATATC